MEAPLRRPALLLAPIALLTLASTGAALSRPERFRAAVVLEAVWRGPDEALLAQRGIDVASRRSRLIRERVTTPSLVERVVHDLKPYEAESGAAASVGVQVKRLAAEIEVRPLSPSSFAVEFVHRDPAVAARVANQLGGGLAGDSRAGTPGPLDLEQLEARVVEAHRELSEKAAAAGNTRPTAPTSSPSRATPAALQKYDDAQRAYQRALEDWQAAATAAMQAPSSDVRFQLLRAAGIPGSAEPRNLLAFALLGGLLGLTIGVVAVLAAEYRDRTVKGPEHLREILPVPLLAMLPDVRARDLRD